MHCDYDTNKYYYEILMKDNLGFSYRNCGEKNNPVQIKNIFLSPDPLLLPGYIIVGGSTTVTNDIVDPIIVF